MPAQGLSVHHSIILFLSLSIVYPHIYRVVRQDMAQPLQKVNPMMGVFFSAYVGWPRCSGLNMPSHVSSR